MSPMQDCDEDFGEIVQGAQAGESHCLGVLAEHVGARVYPYVARTVLDRARTEDLTQDIVLAVLESLGNLKQPASLWPWVFQISTNKMRLFFRRRSVERRFERSQRDDAGSRPEATHEEDGLAGAMREELVELTRTAMADIGERHRMVLALRIYEDLPHAEIARIVGCTTSMARAMFVRARRALKKQLRRQGVSESAFAAALAAFGQWTLPPSAAAADTATVSAVALSESAWFVLPPVKTLAVIAALGAAVALSVWGHSFSGTSGADEGVTRRPFTADVPRERPVVPDPLFVHYTTLAPAGGACAEIDPDKTGSRGLFEQWLYFPEGPAGPFLRRTEHWDSRRNRRHCWQVDNAQGSHYVNLNRQETWRLSAKSYFGLEAVFRTRLLPTDPPDFCTFVRETETGTFPQTLTQEGLLLERDPGTGFLISSLDKRFSNLGVFETTYDYGEQDLGLFESPSGMKVVDDRDAMRRRGWTYFRVTGELGGRAVTGQGRLPFTLAAREAHGPWLRLKVGDDRTVIDDGRRTVLLDEDHAVIAACPGGSLFNGMPRPWTGFHTLDTIRRDAARDRLWFSTTQPLAVGSTIVEVTVVDVDPKRHTQARYAVDIDRDVLDRIELWTGRKGVVERSFGSLEFEYLSHVDQVGDTFTAPTVGDESATVVTKDMDLFWPVQLLSDSRR